MLDSYWWSFITMTTVGYGDVIPHTHQGRVIGICCAVFGVIIIGSGHILYIGGHFNIRFADTNHH